MRFFLAVIFLTFCTYHLNGQEATDIELIAPSQDGIDYKIQWPETLTPEMIKRMESVSMLLENKSRLPGSIGGLMKRIEKGRFADIWARKTMTEGELSLFFAGSCAVKNILVPPETTNRFDP